jgi:hypothetical protein
MRLPILIATVLALSACGKNDQAGTAQNVDEGMTAESIVSNDVTAIDAVTGDAANMAADVDMNFGNLDEGSGVTNAAPPSKPSGRKSSSGGSAPAAESNSAAPATTNTTVNSE